MIGNKVVVLGGTGFVGHAVVNELSKQGYTVTVCVRRPERHREMLMYPNTTLTTLFEANSTTLTDVLAGSDVVMSLYADRTAGAENMALDEMVDVTKAIKQSSDNANIKRIMHLSQIGADQTQFENKFLRVLGETDSAIHNSTARVTVLRAGLLIGNGDETTTRYSNQLDRVPLLPVFNAKGLVQPLEVNEFAQAMVQSIRMPETEEIKFDVAGEECLSLGDLADMVATIKGVESAVSWSMCRPSAAVMSALGGFAPICSVSSEQRLNVASDLTTDDDFSTRFGFTPTSLQTVLAAYVAPSHMRARYDFYRQDAGRDANELT